MMMMMMEVRGRIDWNLREELRLCEAAKRQYMGFGVIDEAIRGISGLFTF